LETDPDFQVLAAGDRGGIQNPADSGSVDRDRLFHENMLSGPNGFLEMNRPKPGWSCENDDIGLGDRFLVGVEPDELALGRNIDLIRMSFFQIVEAFLKLVSKGVGHSDEANVFAGVERLVCRAGAAAAASD